MASPILVALRRDRPLQVAAGVAAVVAMLTFFRPLWTERVVWVEDRLADPCCLLLVLWALLGAARAFRASAAGLFWRLLFVGMASWTVGDLTSMIWPAGDESTALPLAIDLCYLLFYLAAAMACEVKPHVEAVAPEDAALRRLDLGGTALTASALVAYFVLIPVQASRGDYLTYVPSHTLFVLLDVALMAQFGLAASRAWFSAGWRLVYLALAIAFGAMFVMNGRELASYARQIEVSRGSAFEVLRYLPLLLLVAAPRLAVTLPKLMDPTGDATTAGGGPPRALWAPLGGYAVALPAIHLFIDLTSQIAPVVHLRRGLLVVVASLILGGLAVAQHRALDARARHLNLDLERAREQLRDAQKMEALGRLAGGVAHDFNNLLGVIVGYSELLADDRGVQDRNRRYVEQIRIAGDRATALTRRLLTFTRREVVEPQALAPDVAIRGAADMLGRLVGENIALRLALGAPGHHVMIDPAQFDQVLLNLVANAKDAMPDGGTLTIETAVAEAATSESTGGTLAPGPSLRVTVADDGVGMTPEVRAHLFEPFFTTKARGAGTGLGLSMVYGIVTQAGGVIDVWSEPGRGARVHLYLPDVSPPEAESPAGAEVPPAERLSGTVLLVEDNNALRELIETVLVGAGYTVIVAPNGAEGLRIAAAHAGPIDLLVTDVVMPGLGGTQLAERMREARPGLAALFISGYAEDASVARMVTTDRSAFLQKPFSAPDLLRAVDRLRASMSHVPRERRPC